MEQGKDNSTVSNHAKPVEKPADRREILARWPSVAMTGGAAYTPLSPSDGGTAGKR